MGGCALTMYPDKGWRGFSALCMIFSALCSFPLLPCALCPIPCALPFI